MSASIGKRGLTVKYVTENLEKLIMALSSLERIISPRTYRLRQLIGEIINRGTEFGLPDQDAANAIKALNQDEFEVALDTVIAQLFEFSIPVDESFLAQCREVCELMEIDWERFAFAETLIR